MFDLTGKTALITGATGGIGNAIARALHHQGATVAISGTRREVLDQFAGELGRDFVALRLGQMALQDGRCRSLAEVRFEDRGEREAAALAASAGAVRPRRHRRGR